MQCPNGKELFHALSQFADGELDGVSAREMQDRLANNSEAAETLTRIRQLSNEARRAVRAATPRSSGALRERLHQLALPATPDMPTARFKFATRWRQFAGTAVVAVLLLAIGAGVERWNLTGERSSHHSVQVVPVAEVIPARVIASAEEIHGVCSRLALGLHSAGYPADIAALADAVERDLHSDHPYPDLRSIGYAFRGAGPCGKPLPETAHLLYRSLRPGSVNAVSVLVQPWRNQYALQPDHIYTVSIAQSPFPMLAWRSQDVVYFLLADDAATEDAALRLIQQPAVGAPR